MMNEDSQVMSSPNATTGVDDSGQRPAPTLNGVQNPMRALDLDGEVLGVSRAADVPGHPIDRVELTAGSSSMTGGQLREEAARFLTTASSGISGVNTFTGQPSGTLSGSSGRVEAPRGSHPSVGGVNTRPGVPLGTPPPPPKDRGSERDGYLSAQSVSPENPGRPPSEGQLPQTPLFDTVTYGRLRDLHNEAPHLFSQANAIPSAGGPPSTHSSDIQAEVRRQLSELMVRHDVESERMRKQIELLASENRELRSRMSSEMRGIPSGPESSNGIPGLGWLGRGIGSILGQAKGTSSRPLDLQAQKAPSPPPPPPAPAAMDFGPSTHHYEPGGTASSGFEGFASAAHVEVGNDGQSTQQATFNYGSQEPTGSNLDPLNIVLTGMAQLQGVVSELAASPKAAGKPEVIKPGVNSLPDLPEASNEACLEFSDWLHNTRPALADVSDTSGDLWELVVQEAGVWYSQYLRKTPIERLTLKAIPSDALQDARWIRVSRRIETMIIAAAPSYVREELSASRVSGLFQVVCRLYVIYAPGGLSEREIGLRQIQDPQTGSTVKETIGLLRKWQRWCARMKDLGSTLPDCSLRVKALERMTKAVLAANPDLSFRINLTRAALQIDIIPDDLKVEQLHAQMLSELEAVSHRAGREADKEKLRDQVANPKVRGVESQESASPPPKSIPKSTPKTPSKAQNSKAAGGLEQIPSSRPRCSFYYNQGCKKGNDCTFEHDWSQIPIAERPNRCKTCGGKGHRSSECRSGLKNEEKAKAKGSPKNNNNPKTALPAEHPVPPPPPAVSNKDAMLKSMLADAAAILHQTVPNQVGESTSQRPPPVPISPAPAKATPQANSVTQGTPVTIESLAAQLEGLRTLAQNYEARTCIVDQVLGSGCEVSRVLLDSGATHAVIPYGETLQGLEPVSVTLAGDGRQSWYRTRGGTLVVPPSETGDSKTEPPQTILPLGALVESLGCSLTWSKRGGLKVVHPKLGVLKTGVAQNTCPYLQECQALQLIEELEMSRLKELETQVSTLEWKMTELDRPIDPTEALRKFGSSGSRRDALMAVFSQPYLREVPPEVKLRLAEEIPRRDSTDGKRLLKRLPLSRAVRRSLFASRRWIVQLCDGSDVSQDPIRVWGKANGCEVVQVDLLRKGGKGWDLTKPEGVWSVLLWAAIDGRIACITSSAPRRSWLTPTTDRGEDPLRGSSFWGSDLGDERVFKENLILIQDMFLWSLASVFRGRGIPLVKEFCAGAEREAQGNGFWSTGSWRSFEKWARVETGIVPVEADDGKGIHHVFVGTNLDLVGMKPLDGSESKGANGCWPLGFRGMIERALSGNCPVESIESLDQEISEGLRRSVKDPCVAGAVRAADRDLTPEELEGWKAHIAQGHLPYRRDCLHCVQGSGLGIQHRRIKHPSSYSLSIDLFGPMTAIEKGQDEEAVSGIAQIKYGLIGAFRVPRNVLKRKPGEGPVCDSKEAEAPPEEHLEDLAEYEPSLPDDGEGLGSPVLEDIQDLFESSEVGIRAFSLHDESRDQLPWSDEKIPTNEEELQEYLKGLMVPPDQAVLRFFIGLKSKTGVDVTAGIQKMILTIMKEYPVRTLHCDPGTEFTSDVLKRWLSDQMISLQHPLPADKQANGLAERTIGWSKARARTLLSATGIPVQFWPLAMRYACETHNRIEKGESPLPAFGQQVLHKLKRTPTSTKELMRRWVMTKYLAPHLSVPGGHVLLTDQGTLVASKGFRVGLVDPEALEQARLPPLQELDTEESEVVDPDEELFEVPLRRVRGKTSVRTVGCEDLQHEDLESMSHRLSLEEDYSQQSFRVVAQKLQQCEVAASGGRKVDFGGRFVFGAYCHGGLRGATSLTTRRPCTARYLNSYLKQQCKSGDDPRWSSVMLMAASEVEPHKDFRNEWGTKNFVAYVSGTFELRVFSEQEERPVAQNLGSDAVSFDPRKIHSVHSSPGWFIAAYTPLGSGKIDPERQKFLYELGFDFFEQEPVVCVRAVTPKESEVPSEPDEDRPRMQGAEATCQLDLTADEQPDSVTSLIGWDVNRGDEQPTVFEEADLATYLEERGVACELERLNEIGVQEAVDLPFLYLEDLVEAGIPEVSARRIMFGIHPEGTVRPDEPSTCALRTGEVRLYDRAQRQIPWVIQNRTLDFSRPPPPVQGIGLNEELEVQPHPGHELFWGPNGPVDPEETGEVPVGSPTEIRCDLPEESTASRVVPMVVNSSDDPPCGSDEVPFSVSFSRFAFNNTADEMMRLQTIWDAYDEEGESQVNCSLTEHPQSQEEGVGLGDTLEADEPGSGISCSELGSPSPAEISDLPEESTASRVPNYSCKALAVGGVTGGTGSSVSQGQDSESFGEDHSVIGVPTSDPVVALNGVGIDGAGGDARFGPEVRRVDESFYTPSVETLLRNLEVPLKVVHNVSPSEVRLHLEEWKQAALTEVNALEGMKAIVRLRGSEANKELHLPGTQVLPAKTVFTVKPGSGDNYFRRKCRVVGCGNFEEKGSDLDLYAGGIPADALRALLIEASSRGYLAFILDVCNAFLLAPIPEGAKNHILLRPPRMLEQMQITSEGELWRIERAVYGLRQSPKWWGDFRDSTLRTSSWIGDTGPTRFVQSTVEGNVWKIMTESDEVVGFAIIYVDDIMILSTQSEAEKAYDWIRQQWKCTPLQQAEEESPVTFLGVDVHVGRDEAGRRGFLLSQSGYIQELLRCYSIVPKQRAAPVPREWFKEIPEAENYTQEELRAAQRITGELLWVTQRSRVDLAYPVAVMGSWTVRAPGAVKKIGMRLLEYLGVTCDYKLSLIPGADAYNGVTVFSDASFAPYGCNSITGVLVTFKNRAVLWKGKRQGLISLSTAESELIAGCEAVVLAQSAEALLNDLCGTLEVKHLQVDNLAAIVIAEGGGSQRTRHLRVRANFVKDLLDRNEIRVSHCPGDIQLADILTKVLPSARHEYLSRLIGLGPESVSSKVATVIAGANRMNQASLHRAARALMVMIILQQVIECESVDEDEGEGDPLNIDLYVLGLLLTFSVLFVWESGKYCLNGFCRKGCEDEPRVKMVRDEDDEANLRRGRRQEAVRRAIEKESEGIRKRLNKDEGSEIPPPLISVQVGGLTPNPVTPPPPPIPPEQPSGYGTGFSSRTKTRSGASSSTAVEGGFGLSTGNRREVATQTEVPKGLTYEEMCGLEMITSSSRTPGALHIFPECHALRNVTGTDRRRICRYCLQSLKHREATG